MRANLNQQNQHWPLITTVAANGYAGLTVLPRWCKQQHLRPGLEIWMLIYLCDSNSDLLQLRPR